MQMASLLDKQVDAFSIGFHEEDYSELKYAKQAAKKMGIKLHYDIVDHTELQFAPMLINQHYGEPFADSSMLPTWYISRFARQFVPLVLSGDGGDEFFGGYTTYLKWLENSVGTTFKRKLASGQLRSTPYFLLGSLKKYILNGFNQNHLDEWITIGSHQSTFTTDRCA
jgi:asparagine synthetase B (glutamine-hydrolysing)